MNGPERGAIRSALARGFEARYGKPPIGIARAPGRVNLIGEHLDYNGGCVLPAAIERSVHVAFGTWQGREVRAYSVDFDESCVCLPGGPPPANVGSWATYVDGVVQLLHPGSSVVGADLFISGDVPIGAGLSSSAALELATAGALRSMWNVAVTDIELALLCQRAEMEFAGVQCGPMDQLASVFGKEDEAVLIDCATVHIERVALPFGSTGTSLVVVDSGQRRKLDASEYNRRREECRAARELISDAEPARPLARVTLGELEGACLPNVLLRRALHVTSEQARVEQMLSALKLQDIERAGDLLNTSHASLRDDFEVSTPEIDRLVALAQAQPGVSGARLTGAGFGGSVVALVSSHAVDALMTEVVERFSHETGLSARVFVCVPSAGLEVLDWPAHA